MDPITTAMVAALAAGVLQGAGAVGKQLIVDAYTALRDAIKAKCGVDSDVAEAVEKLEQKPERQGRQTELADEIKDAGVAEDQDLVKLAEALQAALAETEVGRKALGKYNISAKQIGVVGDNTTVEGGIRFGTIREEK